MSKKLEGKIAVVTGGTEGIGLATAKLFVKEGAYVFVTGRRQKELDEAVKAIGTNVSGVQGDVAQLADLDRLYESIAKVKGRIDIVFANAGVGEFVPFGAVTEEHFDKPRWDAWGNPRKLLRCRCFWRRMTPVSSRVSNYSLTAAERRSNRVARPCAEEHRYGPSNRSDDGFAQSVRRITEGKLPRGADEFTALPRSFIVK
jgi:hypothetical protein